MGESRKGFVPSSGIPDCIASLGKRLGRRSRFVQKMRLRAQDSELATLLFQRTLDPVEFILRTSGVQDPAMFDLLQAYGLEIFSVAVRTLIQKGLVSESRSLEKCLYEDLFAGIQALQAVGVPGHYAFLHPAFGAYNDFEEAVGRTSELGFLSLSESYDLLDVIGEVVVDPLRESSWGLSRRQRQIRASSRLARACREVGDILVTGGDVAVLGQFMPPMPMKETVKVWTRPGSYSSRGGRSLKWTFRRSGFVGGSSRLAG
jgi:hypothetical protein